MSKYRPAAVQAAIASHTSDEHLEVMRPLTWVAGVSLVALLLLALIWSCFVNVPITVASRGILTAPGGVIDIVSDTTGILGDLTVRVNETITPGMELARVEQPDVLLELSSAEGALEDAQDFAEQLRIDHEVEARALETYGRERNASLAENIRLLEAQRVALSKRLAALEGVAAQRIVTEEQLLSVSAELISLDAQIAQGNRERHQLAVDEETNRIKRQREALDAARQIAETTRAVDSLRQRLDRLGVVRASYGGRIVELKSNGGDPVERGTPLMVVERLDVGASSVPIAIAYFSAEDGKKISRGQTVEVSPVNTEREEDGFIRGRVLDVSEIPSSSEGMQRTLHNDLLVQNFSSSIGAPFEVRIALETRPDDATQLAWSTLRAPTARIEPGTPADLSVTVKSVRLISLIIPVVRRLLGIDLILKAHAAS